MKSLSTAERTNELRVAMRGSQLYTYSKVTYIDDNGDEIQFHDHQYPIQIKKRAEPPRYANVSYEPAAADVSFNVINRGGEYSPKNVSSAKSGILVKNRIFKFYTGNKLTTPPDAVDVALSNATAIKYFMKLSGGLVVPDSANAGGSSQTYFTDLFHNYDSFLYDAENYSPSGYTVWQKDWTDVWALSVRTTVKKITIEANSSYGRVYARSGETIAILNAGNNTTAGWTYLGNTVNGSAEFAVSYANKFAIQVAVVNCSPTWYASDMTVTSALTQYQEDVEWLLAGTFYLDDPKFDENRANQLSEIKVTGRNGWKKALETEINLADLSGGVALTDLIKTVCDRVGILYTSTSIANLSAYGNRTLSNGLGDSVKASTVLGYVMIICGASYRMKMDDSNVLYVEARPTASLADTVFSYKRYEKATQQQKSEKQLQRATIFTDKQVLNEVVSLGSPTTFTTSGVQTAITWTGNAISKYWVLSAVSGTLVITGVQFTNTSAIFTTAGAGSLTVQVKGNKFRSTQPMYKGEAADAGNIQNVEGQTIQILNPLMISDAECESVADSLVSEFGDPDYNIDIDEVFLNPLYEINDTGLALSRDFLELAVYAIIGMDLVLRSETEKYTSVILQDTGKKITDDGSIIYDRTVPWQYDKGVVYDSRWIGYSQNQIDTSIYNHHNIGYQ